MVGDKDRVAAVLADAHKAAGIAHGALGGACRVLDGLSGRATCVLTEATTLNVNEMRVPRLQTTFPWLSLAWPGRIPCLHS